MKIKKKESKIEPLVNIIFNDIIIIIVFVVVVAVTTI
jgi:hypothetical protein